MSFADFMAANVVQTAPKKTPGPRGPYKKVVVGKTRRKRTVFSADFETTTIAEDCHVWAWGLVEVDNPGYDEVQYGTVLTDFMDLLSKIDSTVYFHNLKFDGHFLLYWLFTHGYKHVTNDMQPITGEFQTLISMMGKFYSITVRWKTGKTTEFRDSLKKLPMSVREVAKTFHLDTTKGDIDYGLPRPVGYIMTEDEIDYLKRDVSIVGQALKQIIAEGMTGLTVASDAMKEYKKVTGADNYAQYFPVLSDDIDHQIRQSYRGGFCYADPRFKHRVNGFGLVLDVNSLYPYVMKSRLLPYGMPKYIDMEEDLDEDPEYPLWIRFFWITAKLKPNHIPCIQIKRSSMFVETEYLTEIEEPVEICVTSVDWALYNEHYDIEIHYWDDGWRFKGAIGLFDAYIDKWSAVKEREIGGRRAIAKLFMNSLYGKFASNPNVTGKVPIFEDGMVRLVRGEDERKSSIYTAVGSFITAYARDITIRAAQKNYDVFAYADTDSLHLLTWDLPQELEIHKTKLGAWKHEYNFIMSFYIRAKAYLEMKYEDNFHEQECAEGCIIQHNFENRIAGLPVTISETLTFADLTDGRIIEGKMHPKVVPGGVILDPTPYKLNLW